MGCITSASFAVLVNGEPSYLFHCERGLKQGCPLSPLLFVLIMEGLSLALKHKQEEGLLTGIKVSRYIHILHLLFADDILIMTKASIEEWKEISIVLQLFCNAMGLHINAHKTTLLQFGANQQVLGGIKALFHFQIQDLEKGFMYLGYFLKMGRYKTEDWLWLLEKIEKRIKLWCN